MYSIAYSMAGWLAGWLAGWPWDHRILGISRIPLNLVKFSYFNGILLNSSNFSIFW